MEDYSRGRCLNAAERLLFRAAVLDEGVAQRFDAFGSRRVRPERYLPTAVPRALAVQARHRLSRRRGAGPALEAA
jgi:hypothetical protein